MSSGSHRDTVSVALVREGDTVARSTWRAIGLPVLALLLGAQAVATAHHGGAVATVEVRAGAFLDRSVHVAPGGEVVWSVVDAGHSIRADDGRFHFGTRTRGVPTGESVSWVAGDAPEVVRYHCEVHGGPGGQGMSGVVVVGDPTPEAAEVAVLRVPEDVPTLADAVAVMPHGRIELAPGEHVLRDPVTVDTDDVRGLQIVGTGADPASVHLRGDGPTGQVESVLRITGTHVTVENLTVSGARRAAIHLDGANQVGLIDVHIRGRSLTDDGVLVTGGVGGGAGLHRVRIDEVRRVGIRIGPCATCGVTIQASEVRGSLVGVAATAAVGVLIDGSVVEDNGAGIVVRGDGERHSSVSLLGNTIRNNTRTELAVPHDHPDRALATGVGIDLRDTFDSALVRNVVSGHTRDVRASGGAVRLVVADNDVTDDTLQVRS